MGKGTINNLIDSDTSEVENFIWMLPYMCSTPLFITLSCWTLYTLIDKACIVAILIVIGLTYALTYVKKFASKFQEKLWKNADMRSNIMNELIENIKIIKMNSWIDY